MKIRWTFQKLLVIVIACVSVGATCKPPSNSNSPQGGALGAYCQSYGAYNPWEASMPLGGGVVAGFMGVTAPILTYSIPGLGGASYPWVFWYSSAAAVATQAAAADAGTPVFGGPFGPGVMSSLTAEIVAQGSDYVLSIGDRQFGGLVEYSNPDTANNVFIPSNYDGSRLWIGADGNPVIFRGHTAQKFISNNGAWIYAGNCYGTLELAVSSTSGWKLCDAAWGPQSLSLTWDTSTQPAILTSIQTPGATVTPKWASGGTTNEGQGSFQGFDDPNKNRWSFNYDTANRFYSFAKPADDTGFQDTVFFSYYANSNVVATISSKAAGNPIFFNLDPKTGLFLGDTIGNGTPSGTPGSIKFPDGTIELVTYGTVPNIVDVNGPAFRTIVVSNLYGSAQVAAGPCVETVSVDRQGETIYYGWDLSNDTPTTGPTYVGQTSPTNSDDTVIIGSYSTYGNPQLSTDVTGGTLVATNYATETADMFGDPSDVVAMPASSLPSNLVFGADWSTQGAIANAMLTHYTYWNDPAATWAIGELATATVTAPAIASSGSYTQTLSYTYGVDGMSNWTRSSTDTAQPKALAALMSMPRGGNFGVRTMTSDIGLKDTVDVEGGTTGQVVTETSGEGESVVTMLDATANPYSIVFNNDTMSSLTRTFDNAGNMTKETSTATGIQSSSPTQTTFGYVDGVLFGQSVAGPDMSVQSTVQMSYDPTTGNFIGEATNGVLDDETVEPGTNPYPDLP